MFVIGVCKICLELESDWSFMSVHISDTFHIVFAIGHFLRVGFVAPVARRTVWFQQTPLLVSMSR